MPFKLTVKTDNAAFDGDNIFAEVAKILRDVANRIEEDLHMCGKCHDTNGYSVGSFKLTRK